MLNKSKTFASLFFQAVTAKPRLVISIGLLVIIGFASFIPNLQKDTRTDAFIPEDHPALKFRDKTKELFGLEDPMVIAVINKGKNGVFNPHTRWLVN
jgi:predicted RND superfamily exporter protein